MSPRIKIAEGADRPAFDTLQKRRYLKNKSIPSATWIRSSIPQISRCIRFRRAIRLGRSVSTRLFLNPQSRTSLHFRQSTRAFENFDRPLRSSCTIGSLVRCQGFCFRRMTCQAHFASYHRGTPLSYASYLCRQRHANGKLWRSSSTQLPRGASSGIDGLVADRT